MTTTTKDTKAAKGNPSPAGVVDDGENWDDAGKATSQSAHPTWAPHLSPQLSTFNEAAIKKKMGKLPEGSINTTVITGAVVIQRAYGEPRYFVDAPNGVRYALPLHGVLTSTLDSMRMDPAPRVRIEALGEAPTSKPNQRAAFLYDVKCKPADALLPQARKDALLPIHRANKEARDAAEKARRAAAGAAAPDVETADVDE